MSSGKNCEVVFLDFSKAFDLVNHSLALTKMRNHGINGKLLCWISEFLSDRPQRVRVSNSLSESNILKSGVPQGSVLGPLIFLIFISDLNFKNTSDFVSILKYVDDSKVTGRIENEEDVYTLQENLSDIYDWADHNNIAWNKLKFQLLRLGKSEDIKNNTLLFGPGFDSIIERKNVIKDLRVLVDEELSYSHQIQKSLSKTRQKIGWIACTFRSRDVKFLRILWNSLVQPHMDYASILVTPVGSKGLIMAQEGPLRKMTKMAWGCRESNYWEHLTVFKLYSNQRRMERYKIIYIWKSLNGLVPSLGLEWAGDSNTRSGLCLKIPTLFGKYEQYKTLQKRSLKVEGAKIVNSIPQDIRLFTGKLDQFKSKLDAYLETLPDQPQTESLIPDAMTIYRVPSNSIIDWARKLP